MSQDDGPAGDVRPTAAGAGSMLSAMAALWTGGPSPEDAEGLPPRYTTATLMLWTLMGVAVATAIYLARFALGSTSPVWLTGAPVMFLPLVLAWSTSPPQRSSGLVWGLLFGVAAAIVVVAGAPVLGVADIVLVLLLGFAVAALVAAWVFGTVTRATSAPHA